ncbi:MAG: hypothetical protein WCQ65_12580, partial [Fermentimonas sp.]
CMSIFYHLLLACVEAIRYYCMHQSVNISVKILIPILKRAISSEWSYVPSLKTSNIITNTSNVQVR